MSGTNSKAEITLNVMVEGDDPGHSIFDITVPLQSRFTQVLKIIQKEYRDLQQISLYGLELYRVNMRPEQSRDIKISDEAILPSLRLVSSEWPSQSDADPQLIHIIVRPRTRQVTSTNRTDTPPSAEKEFSNYIENFNNLQLGFAQRVNTRNSSSAAQPKNFRAQQNGSNFINNGRPANNEGLPITLYHPVFGRFLTQLRSTDPIDPEFYRHTMEHFIVSQDLYEHEKNDPRARDEATSTSLRGILGDMLPKVMVDGVQADGMGAITDWDATRIIIMEMENEIGTGASEPSIRAAQSYARYWSNEVARRWLNWCCCPSILVAIAGPWMCILGGIYLDRPVVQPLTHFLWVGSNPARPSELGYIARVFHCLSSARGELESYYRTSNPPASNYNPARPFPYLTHYMDATGHSVRFVYRRNLCPGNPRKPIFLAETTAAENPRYIVVKFIQSYNTTAHKLLAEQKLAPELLYDGTQYPNDQPGPEHTMIVMEFVQGVNLDEWLTHFRLSQSAFSDIDTALKLLHDHDFVFGDLRPPNVMILQDSSGAATGRAMLVDFDWCGKHLEGRYPLKMNVTLEWHKGVEPGVSPAAFRKLVKEIQQLRAEPPEGIRVVPSEENMLDVTGIVAGPEGTPFAGGYFHIHFSFPPTYPASPPSARMLTKIFHPNVSRSGEICVNTLKKDWKPTYGLGHVLVTIKCLLIVPNAESALDEEAGKLLLEDWDEFCSRAKMWCSVHATPKVPPVEFQTAASSSTATVQAKTVTATTSVVPPENTMTEPVSPPKSKLETTAAPVVQQSPLQPSAAGNVASIIPEQVPTTSVKPPSTGKSASGTENGASAGVVKTTAKRVATGGVEKKKKALKRL